ncbi:MAG: DUF4350 domain-containing protein [Bacteroidota bacterium]
MISRKDAKYLSVFLLVFALVVWANAKSTENPWEVSFQRGDTRAYGSSILFDTMPYLFENKEIRSINFPPYTLLEDTSIVNTNYLFITRNFDIDKAEADALLRYVARGNTLFIAADVIQPPLSDLLDIKTDVEFIENVENLQALAETSLFDTTRINLAYPEVAAPGGYYYSTDLLYSTLQKVNREDSASEDSASEDSASEDSVDAHSPAVTLPYEVLGSYEDGGYNFLRVAYGAGAVLVSSVPLAFTNFNMLYEGNDAYAYAALSYLPDQLTYWDAYYKPGRPSQQTPLRYVLSSEALRMAYYLGIFGLLFFMASNARRRQRVMPIVVPKENRTLEFATTVGRLYFNEGDHTNLAQKQLEQFKHFMHSTLHLPNRPLTEVETSIIAARTGVPAVQVDTLFTHLLAVEQGKQVDAAGLSALANELDQFYKASTR